MRPGLEIMSSKLERTGDMAKVDELTRTDLLAAFYSLAHAYEDDGLQVGETVWVFHKSTWDHYSRRGPVSKAVVTARLGDTGRAVEVIYPDGEREQIKVRPFYGFAVVRDLEAEPKTGGSDA